MAVGVICEYNPFHKGHLFHLEKTRAAFPGEPIVAVMSGNLVQRGDIAVLDKTARAKMALLGGADLVVELPLAAACASAGDFACGGVETLVSLGVDKISFGSEAGDADLLSRAAAATLDLEFDLELRRGMEQGLSFASARQRAAELAAPELAAVFASPNNLLAIEYLRAAKGRLAPFPVKRAGAPHDGASDDQTAPLSASLVRAALARGSLAELSALPGFAREIIQTELNDHLAPAFLKGNDRVVLAHLRRMSAADFLNIPDCSEGLEGRIVSAVKTAETLEELYDLIKTKRYAHSRIRRIITRAFFGITRDVPVAPPYLRLLGVSRTGRKFLKERRDGVKIITRPSEVKAMSGAAQDLFALESRVTDLWSLFTPKAQESGGEWRRSPVFLENSAAPENI